MFLNSLLSAAIHNERQEKKGGHRLILTLIPSSHHFDPSCDFHSFMVWKSVLCACPFNGTYLFARFVVQFGKMPFLGVEN